MGSLIFFKLVFLYMVIVEGVIGIKFFNCLLRFGFIINGIVYELFMDGVISIGLFSLSFLIKLDRNRIFFLLFLGFWILEFLYVGKFIVIVV